MKKNPTKLKRALTLVEIMVVIMLITMITGTVAYNYGKSLDKGREFKTKEILARVETILNLAHANGELDPAAGDFEERWKQVVSNSPLVKSGSNFLRDANNREVKVHPETVGDQTVFKVTSG